jgi:hypothetical protein
MNVGMWGHPANERRLNRTLAHCLLKAIVQDQELLGQNSSDVHALPGRTSRLPESPD